MHSQRINEALTNTWIKTTDDGEVNCAHCDCMAGLGEVCSHVEAVLFYVEAVRRSKSCTDVPCSWSMQGHRNRSGQSGHVLTSFGSSNVKSS